MYMQQQALLNISLLSKKYHENFYDTPYRQRVSVVLKVNKISYYRQYLQIITNKELLCSKNIDRFKRLCIHRISFRVPISFFAFTDQNNQFTC
jgi:hypothetical protein